MQCQSSDLNYRLSTVEEFDELLEAYPGASPSCVESLQAQVLSLFEELLHDPAAASQGPLSPDR